ncbi:type III secretory pathway component EscR [Agrobacterium rubi]|nr:type III secretory pathway component EscR [Agrobacterium rubi]
MLSDIAAWFITLFVLNPIQADVQERMQGANASAQSIQQS